MTDIELLICISIPAIFFGGIVGYIIYSIGRRGGEE